uniref:Sodium channel regulatory subunit beta-3 n=1 Tax=Astyanax mexicanus TaxID=7994 RepID=A0A8B9HRJ3_ASTMX
YPKGNLLIISKIFTKDVETEAVLGKPIKLTCISCMKREEIEAKTKVDWYFYNSTELRETVKKLRIYEFNRSPPDEDGPWKGRLLWNGSKDLQDVSISITNVTLSDAGRYMCVVSRTFSFNLYTPTFTNSITINLVVREKATLRLNSDVKNDLSPVSLILKPVWQSAQNTESQKAAGEQGRDIQQR